MIGLFISRLRINSNIRFYTSKMTKKNNSNKKQEKEETSIIKINVNVHPNSKESSIVSFEEQKVLSLRISEPPIDGQANKGVIEFLSKELNLRKSSIDVGKGSKSRNKSIEIDIANENITKDELFNRINSKLSKD